MKIINSSNVEQVKVDGLKTHPSNPRKGDLSAITRSIEINGFYGSIVAQKSTGYILAGNHRYMAAKANKAKEVPVIWVDVDDDEAKRIMLADNRTSDLGGYDEDALAELLRDVNATLSLDGTGYTEADLDALLGEDGAGDDRQEGEDRVSEADALREKWGTERGQIWQVGRHRLMCGDSTSEADVSRLMDGQIPAMVFADPPYGVSIVSSGSTTPGFVGGGAAYNIPFGGKKGRGSVGAAKPFGSKRSNTGSVGSGNIIAVGVYNQVIGDDTTDTAERSVLMLLEKYPKSVHVWWGGNYFAHVLPPSSCWLVWDKVQHAKFADAELAWTNQKTAVRIFQHQWCGLIKASEHGQKRVHPTQKPIALAEWVFEKYGEPGDIVLDPFAGSFMSAVACEKTGRCSYSIEMAEDYLAVGLQRLADMGLSPELIEA